ncbi:MAG: AgmX/PglI C-terminal domain-containing protein [Polyangiaceae bacterium]|nr:AgmX/PglI C-terminal domain-containing protein [Polyangiaceae bacterium]
MSHAARTFAVCRTKPVLDLDNPFAAAVTAASEPVGVTADAPEGASTYAMIRRSSPPSPEEVELVGVPAVEVMILWGQNVLHVAHLPAGAVFHVGEERRVGTSLDFLLPAERIGTTLLPVVLASARGPVVVIPAAATGVLERGGKRVTLDAARAEGEPSVATPGATEILLLQGTVARFTVGGFTLQVAATNAGRPLPRALAARLDTAAATSFGLSFLCAATLIATMAATVPSLALTGEDGIEKSKLRYMQAMLATNAEQEQAAREAESTSSDDTPGSRGGDGTRASANEGSMGKPNLPTSGKRWGAAGDAPRSKVELARVAALEEARRFGMIGMLNAAVGGDPNAPTVPWGGNLTIGADPTSALGNMWGDEIGESGGVGGLGLSGVGEGSGGRGEGIGLGGVNTYGHGTGCVSGNCSWGIGNGHGRLGPGHATKEPVFRTGKETVSGRLPPEVIQRIVRQNFGRFRMCYEKGLAQNPNLTGRVSVRFVIGSDGAVSHASNGGSDLADSSAVSCVVSSFYSLSFPAPEAGVVTVVYPIMFQPG